MISLHRENAVTFTWKWQRLAACLAALIVAEESAARAASPVQRERFARLLRGENQPGAIAAEASPPSHAGSNATRPLAYYTKVEARLETRIGRLEQQVSHIQRAVPTSPGTAREIARFEAFLTRREAFLSAQIVKVRANERLAATPSSPAGAAGS